MDEIPDSLLAADEPAPVTVHNENGLSPFLIVADHAGNFILRAFSRLGLPESDCEAHIASERTLEVVAPAEGTPFAYISAGSGEDIDRAVKAARRAVEEGSWGRLSATERGRLLSRLAVAIADHSDEPPGGTPVAIYPSASTGTPSC